MKTQAEKQASSGRLYHAALSRKDFACEVKAIDEDTGAFELYAAAFGNVDRVGEVIQPGAFKNLDEFVKVGWITINHDAKSLPIALIDSAEQDGYGLKIRGRFHSTECAQECRTVVRERMAAGKAVLCSIGYRTIEEATERRGSQVVNVLKSIEIFEASFVNLPANPAAGVTAVKSTGDLIGLDAIKSYVDSVKAGRTLSSANHKKLRDFCKGLDSHGRAACDMARGLEEWLIQYGPMDDGEDDGEDEKSIETNPAEVLALRCRLLQHRSRRYGS